MNSITSIGAQLVLFAICAAVLLVFAIGIIVHTGIRSTMARGVRAISDWWIRLRGGVPWLPQARSLQVSGATHGVHQTAFVSRHHLAEGGLTCPLCQTKVAEAGDFRGVYRTMVDGRENEVVVCTGVREVGDEILPCATLLLASPDTEHGDHLGDDGQVDPHGADPPSYYQFVRVDAEAAIREKWGVEITSGAGGDLTVTDEALAAQQQRQTAPTEPQLPAVKG